MRCVLQQTVLQGPSERPQVQWPPPLGLQQLLQLQPLATQDAP